MMIFKLVRPIELSVCKPGDCVGAIVIADSASAAAEIDPTGGKRTEHWIPADQVVVVSIGPAAPNRAAGEIIKAVIA